MSSDATIVPVSSTVTAYLQLPGGWFRNNAGWVRGSERTLLVDTCATEVRTRRLLASLNGTTPWAVALTHAHGDHTHGARLAADAGATVLAAEATAEMVRTGPHLYPQIFSYEAWGDIAPPERITVVPDVRDDDLGGVTAELHPVPNAAHTGGDLVVWVPEDGVLFAGDLLFHGSTPLALHGSIAGWLETLSWLDNFAAHRTIPGHGPLPEPGTRPTQPLRDYFRWLLDVTGDAEPDFTELERQAVERWPHWGEAERHAVNLRVAHADNHGRTADLLDLVMAMLHANDGPIQIDL